MNVYLMLWGLILLSLGYTLRWLQEYAFFTEYRRRRRQQAQVAVDTARILNGITDKVPVVALSPLIRQYLTDKKALRETIMSWFMRRPAYVARHSSSGYSTWQKIQMTTATAPLSLEAVTEE